MLDFKEFPLKETLVALAVLSLVVMVVGITTIVRALRQHKTIQLDWSGMGFDLKISAEKPAGKDKFHVPLD